MTERSKRRKKAERALMRDRARAALAIAGDTDCHCWTPSRAVRVRKKGPWICSTCFGQRQESHDFGENRMSLMTTQMANEWAKSSAYPRVWLMPMHAIVVGGRVHFMRAPECTSACIENVPLVSKLLAG